jgi:DNA (cytosine-5)-methyltransferase 1
MPKRADRSDRRAGELVSLFCGAGGLDLGFEKAGFTVMAAVDVREPSIDSYNHNRRSRVVGHVADVSVLSPAELDRVAQRRLDPVGVIGGPPCQSFSRAAHSADDDHRHELTLEFARLLKLFNRRSPVKFFAFENVPGLVKNKHKTRYQSIVNAFAKAGFSVHAELLNALSFGVAQDRPRLILVGYNARLLPGLEWTPPEPTQSIPLTVRSVIGKLREPKYWERGLDASSIPVHPNHWCMVPKSKNFTARGALVQGTSRGRSFRTLDWTQPSPTVPYGNR